MTGRRQDYTERAAAAVLEAAQAEHDFGGWLASILAAAAAELGSGRALVARRPGSWEADLVIQLVCGTVGWNDEYLRRRRIGNPNDCSRTEPARSALNQPRAPVKE